jgi:hypothetical protein
VSFKIGGLDVWKHQWHDTKERAQVQDPHYHQDFTFHVYEIQNGGQTVAFAAGEFSNSMWGFYVRKSFVKRNLGNSPVFSAFELKPGSSYRVKASFIDHEGSVHPVGESWRFESHAFIPYHAGLSLNVTDARGTRQILLQDYPEAQGKIVAHFSDYVEESIPPVDAVMNTAPPLLPVSPKSHSQSAHPAVVKGVWIGATVTVSMSLCSWLGISGFGDKPNAFQVLMTILNLPSIFIAFGEKGRPGGGYHALAFLIVVQWAIVGSMVGFVVARRARGLGNRG